MRRPLLWAVILFVMGEVAARVMDSHPAYSIALAVASIILCAIFSNRNALTKSNNLLLFLLLFSISASGAVWSYGYYSGKNDIRAELDPDIVRMDYIISGMDNTASGVRLTLKYKKGMRSEPITMYLKSDESSDEIAAPEPGRYITVTGRIEEIEGATNPGQMDLREYYLSRGIKYQIKADYYEVSEKVANPVTLYLWRLRKKAAGYIDQYFAYEEAGILKNMILGDKSGMSPETRILFQRNGIAHILAISGLHIMLLASFIEWLLSKMYVKKNAASAITIIFMLLYGVMTGMSHATMRALLMLIIGRSAFAVKRTPDTPTTMAEALLIMMMINPDCIFGTGLLMSFAALSGVWIGSLVYEGILGNERFKSIPEKLRPLAKTFCTSVILTSSISLMLSPLLLLSNYEIPLLSMLLNLVVTTLLSFVIGCGFIVIVMGFLADLLGVLGLSLVEYGASGVTDFGRMLIEKALRLPVTLATWILRLYRLICEKLPSSSIIITGHLEVWQIVLVYLIIALVLFIYLDERLRRRFYEELKRRLMRNRTGMSGVKTSMMYGRNKYMLFANVPKEERIINVRNLSDRKKVESMRGSKKAGKKEEKVRDLERMQRRHKFQRVLRYMLLCAALIICMAGATKLYNLSFSGVIFMDVGQGDGSIIRSSAGRNYIIDCGSSDREEIGRYTLVPALKYYGMGTVDAVMLSHTDSDHVSGLIELLENRKLYGIKVNVVVVAEGTDPDDNYMRIRNAFGEINEAGAGDLIDGVFRVIYPEETGNQVKSGNDHSGNDYSLVVDYRDGDIEVLYTGDIGMDVEENLLEEVQRLDRAKLRVLKCAHHGSKYSSSEEFLAAYKPDVTVISSGRNNYGHPSPVTLLRLKRAGTRIIRTDTYGAVIID